MATPGVQGDEPDATARLDSVTRCLSSDHDRLRLTLESVVVAFDDRRFDEARERYALFARGLRHHMRMEEELLFPVFEARTGLDAGPTAVMRQEHRTIEDAAATIGSALDRNDAAGFAAGLRFLEEVLVGHESKEEHVLYPITDALLSPAERRRLTARLECG